MAKSRSFRKQQWEQAFTITPTVDSALKRNWSATYEAVISSEKKMCARIRLVLLSPASSEDTASISK